MSEWNLLCVPYFIILGSINKLLPAIICAFTSGADSAYLSGMVGSSARILLSVVESAPLVS